MGYDSIHETVIDTVVKTLQDGINAVEKFTPKSKDISYYGSLTQANKGLVLEFPVLISKANGIENASVVSKAYEAKFVTMLHMALAACSITNVSSGIDYIKNFHTNLDSKKMNLDDFMSIMDDNRIHENSNITSDTYSKIRSVKEDMKNLNYYFNEDTNDTPITKYKIFKEYGNIRVVKEEYNPAKEQREKEKLDIEKQKLELNKKKDEREEEKHIMDKAIKSNEYDRNNLSFGTEQFKNRLLSNDVKKANELTPTMMIVNCVVVENDQKINKQFVIGVKAKLYEVEPSDVINKIITKHVDSNILLKLVKVSTREISFVKDFMLALDSAKLDALSKSKRGSANKLFKVLERRALNGKIRRTLKMKDYSKAISSLVISQEEVEELKKRNIDVTDTKVIRPIMEKLNLISFAIIDESSDSVKFIFDTGDDVYETVPIDKLEREQRDGMSKKVINLMAKMNR